MKINRLLARVPRWILITSGILVLLSAGLFLFLEYRLKPILTKKIKETVVTASKGLYTVDFVGIRTSLWRGGLSFDSLSIKPDTAVLEQMRSRNEAPKHIFQVDVRGLAFNHIRLGNLYFDKKLDMSSIVIIKPLITVTYNDFRTLEEDSEKRTLYEQLSRTLKSVKVDEVVVSDADIKYVDRSSRPAAVTAFKGLNIQGLDLLIDSASQYDKTRFYYTRDIRMNLKDHRFVTDDGLYTISIGDLTSSVREKTLRLARFRVKPNYPELEFSRKYKTQHDRYDLNFAEILARNVDFMKLSRERRLSASSLIINGSVVNIFMNRAMPPVTFDKGRNYPHVVIRRLRMSTTIDSLFIKDTRITYSEYNPKSKKTGRVTFARFNALLKNVSNDSIRLQQDHWVRASVSTYLMNKGRMDVTVNMDLTAQNADFNFQGTMGKMNMTDLNALSRNMSLAEIRSGTIQKAIFDVKGNWRTSSGTLRLYYNDLKVDVLKNDEETNQLQKRGLISAIANTLIIKNDNPDPSGELRIGKTEAYRINSASFFNLMWKSVFEGLKESVGFTLEKPQTQATKPATDPKTQRKLEREKRREERRKNRN